MTYIIIGAIGIVAISYLMHILASWLDDTFIASANGVYNHSDIKKGETEFRRDLILRMSFLFQSAERRHLQTFVKHLSHSDVRQLSEIINQRPLFVADYIKSMQASPSMSKMLKSKLLEYE